MKYKSLKTGEWCSAGIDEVRHEYVLENLEGSCSAPSYYSITKEEFNAFPWEPETFLKYRSSSRFLCSCLLRGQNLEQLCRLYEKEIDEHGSLLVTGNDTRLYKTNRNEFVCIKVSDEDLSYDILGIGNQSILPGSLVERLLGPRYFALKEIKPVVKEIVTDYIKKHPDEFKLIDKTME